MLRLIVSSHGKLAEELVESSYMIFGRQDGVFALEFDLDEDLNDIKEKYRTVLAGVPENDQVIFYAICLAVLRLTGQKLLSMKIQNVTV